MRALKILTFNIQSGQCWDSANPDEARVDLSQTIAFIRSTDADIIFLQEVEMPVNGWLAAHTHPNFDHIRQAFPDYHACFANPANTRPHLPFGIGIAILSRFPLVNDYHLVLPSADVSFEFHGQTWMPPERSLIGSFTEIDNTRIQLLNTHLQAYFMIDASSDEHSQQRHILKTLLSKRTYPTLLAGDFNCSPREGTIADIESTGMTSAQKSAFTWYRMPMVLDHIFASEEFKILQWTLYDNAVSDHMALEVQVKL